MPLSPEAIARLLPPGNPDFAVPEATLLAFNQIEGRADNPIGRGFLWSQYVSRVYWDNLSSVMNHFQIPSDDPRTKIPQRINPSVGFFPIDRHVYTIAYKYLSDAALEVGYFFGAAVYDQRWQPSPISPHNLPTRPIIPVVQFPVVFLPHTPLDPVNAASTCWARDSNKTGGVLTCKHAISGLKRGSRVAMKDGSTGQLISFAPGSVDAAFIETQNGMPRNVNSLLVESHPVNGATVSVDFRSHHIGSAQILNSWYFADNLDPYNVMRVYIDHWGQRSDSGSLVSTATGKGVGIYTGQFTGNATQQGICQYLLQAVSELKLTAFI